MTDPAVQGAVDEAPKDAGVPGRIAVSPREAARLLGVSVPTVYTLLNAGHIPSVKCGARRLISVRALHQFIGDAA